MKDQNQIQTAQQVESPQTTPRRIRMLVLCPYPEHVAPSQRLKYEQYFDFLRANGYEISVSPFMSLALWKIVYKPGFTLQKVMWTVWGYLKRVADLLAVHRYDLVYIHLWMVPFGPAVFEKICYRLNSNIVYDIDDMVHLGGEPESKTSVLRVWLKSPSRVIALMRCAKHVITCTPALDEFARRFNANTTDISSTINTEVYVPAEPRDSPDTLTLGWSGSHSTARYLALLEPTMRALRSIIRFRLVVIGAENFAIDGIDVSALPWRREREVQDLQSFDIGLYPLPDEPWAYGKSGLKALQYMALAIPTVATALGANYRVIEDGVSGFLVRTPDEWIDRIVRLANDPQLRRRIGAAARDRVVERYSILANRERYLAILNGAAGIRAGGPEILN